jgi:hypothetical protein
MPVSTSFAVSGGETPEEVIMNWAEFSVSG